MLIEPKRNRWIRIVTITGGAVVLCALIALLAVSSWYRMAQKPVSASSKSVDMTIARGESVRQFATDLQAKSLIRSSTVFMLYYRVHRSGLGHVLAGKYALSPNMSVKSILNAVTQGDVIRNTITVTIPEGFDAADIGARLQSAGVCSASSFLSAIQKGNFTQPFLTDLAGRSNVRYRLEGFLFPDTYDFQPHEDPTQVINDMLDDFQRRVLTPSTQSAMKASGQTLNQVITEASLVENEALVDSERPIIASVIDNRLKSGMKLQIDVTVDYALGHHVTVVTDAETQNTKSPYNTYLVSGLPPGPIGSPGLKSIDAVLHPAKTNYLYYVAKGDGSGTDYFAATYSEQLHNEVLRAQNLSKAGK